MGRSRCCHVAVGCLVGLLVLSATGFGPEAAAAAPEGSSSDWRTVSAGGRQTCAIRTTGRLYCWGGDFAGALGNGGADEDRTTPTEVAGGFTDWTAVTAGFNFVCARRRSGRLFCWGSDAIGQLGDGAATTGSNVPSEVAGARTDWAAVSAGHDHVCARRTSGRLFCWGFDADGRLGNGGDDTSATAPVQVAGGRTDWSGVSAGRWNTCARRTTGRLFCWGGDISGVLGNGPAPATDTPGEVFGGRTDWAAVSAGTTVSCARRTTGRLFCWGYDLDGELGNGLPNVDSDRPVQVAGGRTDWTAVSAGAYHVCARQRSGRLFCWGYNGDGRGGAGAPDPGSSAPREVSGGATDWKAVDAGEEHTCALTTSGRLFCWGLDDDGRLGDGGPNAAMSRPVGVLA